MVFNVIKFKLSLKKAASTSSILLQLQSLLKIDKLNISFFLIWWKSIS